jgi:hypothetical protein
MPRSSQNSKSDRDIKKKKPVKELKKEIKKKTPKKEIAKTKTPSSSSIKPQKKARPIIVDIISDDYDNQENGLDDYAGRSGAFEYPDFRDEANLENQNRDEIDNQKKFFAELGSEIENRKKDLENEDLAEDFSEDNLIDLFEDEEIIKKKKKQRPTKVSLYRRFVWRFIFVVTFLALLVFYFSFSKLTIDIIPKGETVNDSIQLKISTASTSIQTISGPQIIKGEIRKVSVTAEEEFSASGEEYAGEAISGKVKIINNYGKSQSLIASTRLLSPDNKIFRIKETISIPAGGEKWADIYVENPSRDYAISPTTFTIPGLWVGLQDKIYAKSEEAFIFEEKKDMYVRPSDIVAAEKGINDEISKKIEQIISDEISYFENSGLKMEALYLIDDNINIEIEAKADDKLSKFPVKASAFARIVFFSKEEAENLASIKIKSRVSDGKELIEFNQDGLAYSLIEILEGEEEAIISASFSGKMVLKGGDDALNKESLVNLNAEQISAYLRNQDEIKDFKLHFSPAFIKKAPRLVDRIKINLLQE